MVIMKQKHSNFNLMKLSKSTADFLNDINPKITFSIFMVVSISALCLMIAFTVWAFRNMY